ncbi:YhcH/YjgK/YiaL family protein [Cryomorphaceae bacterium]|nr:YhcH/YjgK/YiaL family protein [Cryomorphaceae bacterium]
MIVDTLENIEIYKGLSPDIYAGLKWLKEAAKEPSIQLGVYEINERVKAIVSEYETIEHFERGFESHRHVIDIQYPVIGLERVLWSPIIGMEVNIPYDQAKDRTFFKNPHPQSTHVDIGNGVFAIMFEEDGHGPQHYVRAPMLIKKITVKVSTKSAEPE